MPRRKLPALVRRSLTGLLMLSGIGGLGWLAWFLLIRTLARAPQPPDASRTLYPGITYQQISRTKPRPMVIQIVRIDLQTPGLRFLVTPGRKGKKLPLKGYRTTDFMRDIGAQLAINGDYFYPWHSNSQLDYYPHIDDPVTAVGRACSNGDCYLDDPERAKHPSLCITAKNEAFIGLKPPSRDYFYNVISGLGFILQNGKSSEPWHDIQPRTGVGLDKTGRYLILVLVDGRQPTYSEGVTLLELADLLREFGAWNALNFDGGGSTTLAVRDPEKNGTIRILNRPIDCHIPGRERPVANHLAVFVPTQSP